MESNLAQQLDAVEDLNIAIDSFLLKTVEEAVDKLISELPFKDKTLIARMSEEDLVYLNPNLGVHAVKTFEVSKGGKK